MPAQTLNCPAAYSDGICTYLLCFSEASEYGYALCLEHVDVMVRSVWNPAEFADRIGFEALAALAGGYAEAVEALERLKSLLAAALAAAPRLKQRREDDERRSYPQVV